MASNATIVKFSTNCRLCKRLVELRKQNKKQYPEYHARPVASFGVDNPQLVIVGLAPGMHGANRTGRPFTGDHAGKLLYRTLHKYGYATNSASVDRDDGLELIGCKITNAVKCFPPKNKPLPNEIITCNGFLAAELKTMSSGTAILALGQTAHQAILMAHGLKRKDYVFGHGRIATLPNAVTLFDSYHCTRYNTQTRRLTPQMFEGVFEEIAHYFQQQRTPHLSTCRHV